MKKIIPLLPPVNRQILVKLLQFIKKIIENSEHNKMDVSNLGTCLAPNILRPKGDGLIPVEDFKKIGIVFKLLVEHFQELFFHSSDFPNSSPLESSNHLNECTDLPIQFKKELSSGAIRIASLIIKKQEEEERQFAEENEEGREQISNPVISADIQDNEAEVNREIENLIESPDISRIMKKNNNRAFRQSLKLELMKKMENLEKEMKTSMKQEKSTKSPPIPLRQSSKASFLEDTDEEMVSSPKEPEDSPTSVVSLEHRLSFNHNFIIPISSNRRANSGPLLTEESGHKRKSFRKSASEEIVFKKEERGITFIKYMNGSSFEGEVKDGIRHGKGKMTWRDGSVYEGTWKDNLREGTGKREDKPKKF